MTKTEEDSIKKLDRRTVTAYAVVQFTLYCRLRQMGVDASNLRPATTYTRMAATQPASGKEFIHCG